MLHSLKHSTAQRAPVEVWRSEHRAVLQPLAREVTAGRGVEAFKDAMDDLFHLGREEFTVINPVFQELAEFFGSGRVVWVSLHHEKGSDDEPEGLAALLSQARGRLLVDGHEMSLPDFSYYLRVYVRRGNEQATLSRRVV